ncbi:hypothetical protein FNZ56_04950 [Pseudoluteimonas lycopersici]|uniref:Uncharacterized protein n=1 Tax=Pseudoluteimonas lycopersici TaxID=1324796 RepID=A0A516V406_9GAMM|nr:hypothetical protein [Lysobacter lycopersici]QDQ73259.1 hypothetical protein FNZ56_04950 [Lysobacter lycopersici]
MRLLTKSLIAAAVLAAMPTIASAESNFQTGTGSLTATARLDFQITIPKFLYLRVGTGTNLANNTTVDLINFAVPATGVGGGTGVVTTTGGDLTGGKVTARVMGNGGNVTLSSTTAGALNDGGTNTISYSQISTTAAVLTSGTALAAPALADGATTNTTVTATNGVVNRDAQWTYAYANSAVVAAGTYGGVNVNNGRVTYTAVTP